MPSIGGGEKRLQLSPFTSAFLIFHFVIFIWVMFLLLHCLPQSHTSLLSAVTTSSLFIIFWLPLFTLLPSASTLSRRKNTSAALPPVYQRIIWSLSIQNSYWNTLIVLTRTDEHFVLWLRFMECRIQTAQWQQTNSPHWCFLAVSPEETNGSTVHCTRGTIWHNARRWKDLFQKGKECMKE